jgi:peptidoglycan hydrolase-like protein with peptidoglycan-binding domain
LEPNRSALIITVRQGSQGDAVRGVQEEFQFRNLSGDPDTGLAVDGIFGPKTDAAVRGFQQALHQDISSVTVDGIVGPVTWRGPGQRNALLLIGEPEPDSSATTSAIRATASSRLRCRARARGRPGARQPMRCHRPGRRMRPGAPPPSTL